MSKKTIKIKLLKQSKYSVESCVIHVLRKQRYAENIVHKGITYRNTRSYELRDITFVAKA